MQPHLIEHRSADHAPRDHDVVRTVEDRHVIAACRPRHRRQELTAFLRQVARAHPERELRLVMDDYATDKTPDVEAWLEVDPG